MTFNDVLREYAAIFRAISILSKNFIRRFSVEISNQISYWKTLYENFENLPLKRETQNQNCPSAYRKNQFISKKFTEFLIICRGTNLACIQYYFPKKAVMSPPVYKICDTKPRRKF